MALHCPSTTKILQLAKFKNSYEKCHLWLVWTMKQDLQELDTFGVVNSLTTHNLLNIWNRPVHLWTWTLLFVSLRGSLDETNNGDHDQWPMYSWSLYVLDASFCPQEIYDVSRQSSYKCFEGDMLKGSDLSILNNDQVVSQMMECWPTYLDSIRWYCFQQQFQICLITSYDIQTFLTLKFFCGFFFLHYGHTLC